MTFVMLKIPALILLFLGSFLETENAVADGYAGLLLGPSFINQGYGTRLVVGGHVGGKISPDFSVGLYGTYQDLGTGTINPGTAAYTSDVKETILAAEANYFLIEQVYIGAKLGLALSSYSSTGGDSVSSTHIGGDLAIGPAVGADFPIAQNLSAGGELNTIFIVSNADTVHLINLLATLTFHF